MKNKSNIKSYFHAIILLMCSTQWINAQNFESTHGPYLQYQTSNEVTMRKTGQISIKKKGGKHLKQLMD